MNTIIKLLEYEFVFLCEIKPEADETGRIIGYNPKEKYNNNKNLPLNKYGNKTFCKFDVPKFSRKSGVYVLFVNDSDKPVYIGRAVNLQSRWSRMQYGSISPKNCFKGGQSTNCKINSYIYETTTSGNSIKLYFLETEQYIAVESELIKYFNPSLNEQSKK